MAVMIFSDAELNRLEGAFATVGDFLWVSHYYSRDKPKLSFYDLATEEFEQVEMKSLYKKAVEWSPTQPVKSGNSSVKMDFTQFLYYYRDNFQNRRWYANRI